MSTHSAPTQLPMATFVAGRALERIAERSAIIVTRWRDLITLITGDPAHLVAEVR